jgi:hypothetical protein
MDDPALRLVDGIERILARGGREDGLVALIAAVGGWRVRGEGKEGDEAFLREFQEDLRDYLVGWRRADRGRLRLVWDCDGKRGRG